MLVSAHGDVLFAPPDGTTQWREEFEWLELLIFPDMKVALRSYHGRFLSDQLDGSLLWNKETITSQELWGLQLLRRVALFVYMVVLSVVVVVVEEEEEEVLVVVEF